MKSGFFSSLHRRGAIYAGILVGIMLPAITTHLIPLAGAQAHQNAERKNHVTVADVIGMSRFAEPLNSRSFSPDGKRFAFILKKGNLASNTNDFSLYALNVDEVFQHPTPRLLASFSSSSNRPGIAQMEWLEDNDTILFVGENPGEPAQVYAVRCNDGKLRKLTNHTTSVSAFSASADGQRIVYAAESPSYSLVSKDVLHYGLAVSPRSRLVDLIAGRASESGSANYDLYLRTEGAETERPLSTKGRLLFPKGHLFLSPDGRDLIVETLLRDIDPAWSAYNQLELKRVVSMDLPKDAQFFVQSYELLDLVHGGSTALIDAPVLGGELVWTPESSSVIVTGAYLPLSASNGEERESRRNSTFLVEIEIPSRQINKITDRKLKLIGWDQRTRSWQFEIQPASQGSRDFRDTVFYQKGPLGWQVVSGPAHTAGYPAPQISIAQDLDSPPVLVAASADRKETTVILDPNPQLKTFSLGKVEEIKWNDSLGREFTGGLFLPADYLPGEKYPLVIQTHGYKPHDFWIDGPFTTAFAAQPLASHGIAVLQLPLLGSGSPDEGEQNLRAIESAIDYLSQRGLVDRDHVGLIGFSRTSFHVKYAITHSKFHFAAASVTDGVDAGYFQYLAVSNELPLAAREFERLEGAAPFGEGLSAWLKNSPGFLLDRVQTPMQIVAMGPASLVGEWEWFSGLSHLKKAVDFVYIPRGSHVLVKPWERMVSQGGSVDWFSFWLKGEGDPDPRKAGQYVRWRALRKLGGMQAKAGEMN